MKIAIDLTGFNSHFKGGKEKVILNLIRGFYEADIKTQLLIFCYEEYRENISRYIHASDIITFKRKKYKKIFQDLLIRTFHFHKYLKGCHVLFFPIYYTGFARFTIPTVVLPHDIQFKSNKKAFSLLSRIKDTIMYYCDFTLRDYIIAISDFDEKSIKNYYPKMSRKIKKIYNPIIHCDKNEVSKRENFIVINVAFKHKNIETILKAYKMLSDKTEHKLILVGSTDKNKEILKLADTLELTEKVIFTEHLDDKALEDIFYHSALYITASEYEGFGMISVEAMMNRVPVVSTTQEALKEVTFNRAFYYEPYGDEHALEAMIEEVLENYPDENYLDDLREKAIETYSYLKIANVYNEFFKEIASKVFYTDSMSYHNLALYDYHLQRFISSSIPVYYFGNVQYELECINSIRKIYRYSKYSVSFLKAFSYIKSQVKLAQLIKKEKCRLLHMQWSRMPLFDAMLIRIIKKMTGVKFIYTSHDTFTHNMEKKRMNAFLTLMRQADQIIVHTETAKITLGNHGFDRISIINHGFLDIRRVYPPSSTGFMKDGRIIFSLLGYMEEYKGTDLLLKAWLSSTFLLNQKKICLVVIGKNKMAYQPVISSDSNIIYKNQLIDDHEFTAWMVETDVVILPYQAISQSGLLLTALPMKKNFIVNDVGEIATPVKKYNLGWIINENEVDGLRNKLESIIADILNNGLKEIEEEVMVNIMKDYSWEEAGKMTSDLYLHSLLQDEYEQENKT